MNYFIIGDIHGCFNTLAKLLENWNPETDHLISVGDLVDRGNFPYQVITHLQDLKTKHHRVTILKGNHDAICASYLRNQEKKNWLNYGGDLTLKDFDENQINEVEMIDWLEALPIKFETDHIYVSHAGLSDITAALDEEDRNGLLWNRQPLLNIGKVQVHGHTPVKSNQPKYTESSNSWNIDTAACYGYGLTGLRLKADGTFIEFLFVPVLPEDIGNYNNPNDQ